MILLEVHDLPHELDMLLLEANDVLHELKLLLLEGRDALEEHKLLLSEARDGLEELGLLLHGVDGLVHGRTAHGALGSLLQRLEDTELGGRGRLFRVGLLAT